MKKIIILLLGVAVVAVLAFLAFDLSKKEKVSDDLSLIDFAISDTSIVDKIVVYDSFFDNEFTVVRSKSGKWTAEDGSCVKPEIVGTMLETFLKVTLKGYVPDGSMENMKKLMMSKYKKVDIYQKGKWVKTWYVGHSTSDHYGTHMLLETPKRKSDNPVIMGMKGFYGILEPRFTADPKVYQCSNLFSFSREEIKEVEVVNNVIPEDSYRIVQTENEVQIYHENSPLEGVIKDNLTFYLNGFKNIHFNRPNYAYSERQIDSIRAKTPDFQLLIKAKNDSYQLDLYRRPDPEADHRTEIIWDQDYLWGFTKEGELVRMQYFTVGPLIFGRDVFMEE